MKTVLITGTSSGIGRAAAVYLSQRGYDVYAGIRKDEDARDLAGQFDCIKPVILDVTREENIKDAFHKIKSEFKRDEEFCLINNAGIALGLPIECIPMNEARRQFDVNYFGVLAVTQTFLPLIRMTHGRIININSIAGRLTFPFLGLYSSSKFALEALTAALRRELKEFGVKVISINPGSVQTPVWSKGDAWGKEMARHCPPEAIRVYLKSLKKFEARVQESARKAIDASEVVKEIVLALEEENPRTHYFVGGKTKVKAFAARFLPDKWLDFLIQRAFK